MMSAGASRPLPAALAMLLAVALAQTADAQSDQPAPAAAPDGGASYKPPLRGAPGGRVGGASRGAGKLAATLPSIELIAPLDHTGETASATPTLYFYVSQPVALPTQFTISAPLRPAPVLEATFASPPARGLYPLRLADYHVQLEPGVVYTWSVSAIVDTKRWSRNVVASATILRVPTEAAAEAAMRAPGPSRAAALAGAGLWYDAVAAAADSQNLDRHAALDRLLTEVGLTGPADADRALAAAAPAAR
ncbi:MAG TPA: DUF928 domain-containing protein [Stellaceae bacterium]|jgi:hypothetical protein|nr:DUF928 domain-containing protein [Stellaceae bacterium]